MLKKAFFFIQTHLANHICNGLKVFTLVLKSSESFHLHVSVKSFGTMSLTIWFLKSGNAKTASISRTHNTSQEIHKSMHNLMANGTLYFPLSGLRLTQCDQHSGNKIKETMVG